MDGKFVLVYSPPSFSVGNMEALLFHAWCALLEANFPCSFVPADFGSGCPVTTRLAFNVKRANQYSHKGKHLLPSPSQGLLSSIIKHMGPPMDGPMMDGDLPLYTPPFPSTTARAHAAHPTQQMLTQEGNSMFIHIYIRSTAGL